MCFATAALIAGGVGSAVSAAGAIEQGQAVANEAKYNSQVAANNATYASAAGTAQAGAESMKNANVAGRVKAAQAANGVDVNSGSTVDVQEGTREAGNIDTQTTENNALLQAYGYQQTSTLQKNEAEEAPIGADIGAAGGLLGNASSIGFKWNSLQNPGA